MIEFSVAGWWRAHEAAGAASRLLEFPVKAQTYSGKVRIIGDLSRAQIALLKNYFENHPEQELPEWEQAEILAKETRAARIRKVTAGTEITVSAGDLRDALAALAEAAGIEL